MYFEYIKDKNLPPPFFFLHRTMITKKLVYLSHVYLLSSIKNLIPRGDDTISRLSQNDLLREIMTVKERKLWEGC